MKRIIAPTLIALTFTLMFSSTSFAGWTKVTEGVNGRIYYLDFERIRKHGGYVFWWELGDYLKPNNNGDLSGKAYLQGDCKVFRFKYLSFSSHKEPMGGGTGQITKPKGEYADWFYPSPNSIDELNLKKVCSR